MSNSAPKEFKIMSALSINQSNIHLWFIYNEIISDSSLLEKYKTLLSTSEKEQYQRFLYPKHKEQYLITRALVRSVLSEYVPNIQPHQWQFKFNSFNKPMIANISAPKSLQFNLSHCDQMIGLAISWQNSVGIDIENLHRKYHIELIDIAKRYFSKSEVATLCSLSKEQQNSYFFNLWTLKESYIKACGNGLLSDSLDQFSFSFSNDQTKINFQKQNDFDQSNDTWHFWQIQPTTIPNLIGQPQQINPEYHIIAVACQQTQTKNHVELTTHHVIPLEEIQPVQFRVLRQT